MNVETAISIAYGIDGAIFSLFYIPQIISVLKDRTGVASMSLVTWWYWGVSGLLSFAYCKLVLNDHLAALVVGGSTAGCLIIASLGLYKRICFNKELITSKN